MKRGSTRKEEKKKEDLGLYTQATETAWPAKKVLNMSKTSPEHVMNKS